MKRSRFQNDRGQLRVDMDLDHVKRELADRDQHAFPRGVRFEEGGFDRTLDFVSVTGEVAAVSYVSTCSWSATIRATRNPPSTGVTVA